MLYIKQHCSSVYTPYDNDVYMCVLISNIKYIRCRIYDHRNNNAVLKCEHLTIKRCSNLVSNDLALHAFALNTCKTMNHFVQYRVA